MNFQITKDGLNIEINIAGAVKTNSTIKSKVDNLTSTWIKIIEKGVTKLFLVKNNADDWESKEFRIEFVEAFLNNENEPVSSVNRIYNYTNEEEYDFLFASTTNGYGMEQRKRVVNGIMFTLFGFRIFDNFTMELLPEFSQP